MLDSAKLVFYNVIALDYINFLKSNWYNYLDIIQGQLENSVAIKRSEMDNSVWGKDFSQVQQEWNDKKAQAEGYYDQVQKIYQLEQLESKWQAAIRSTSSLKTQKQLTELINI